MNPSPDRKATTLLFNPFVYIAGTQALLLGLLAILLAAYIGALSKTHFDGVIDCHIGASAPFWLFLAEGLIDWLCLAVILQLAGKIFSKTSFRAIDVFGTQALARWPTILLGLVTLPSGLHRFARYLVQQATQPGAKTPLNLGDAAVFFAASIAIFLLIAWFVVLMYKSFSISCNVKGGKVIGVFIAALIAAEVLSKGAIYSLPRPSPAHIVAVASDSSGRNLTTKAEQFVDLLVKNDFAAACARFDKTMKGALPEGKLQEVWRSLQKQVGPFKSRAGTRVATQAGYKMVFVTCQFERAMLEAKVVFNADGQITGLWFVPNRNG